MPYIICHPAFSALLFLKNLLWPENLIFPGAALATSFVLPWQPLPLNYAIYTSQAPYDSRVYPGHHSSSAYKHNPLGTGRYSRQASEHFSPTSGLPAVGVKPDPRWSGTDQRV